MKLKFEIDIEMTTDEIRLLQKYYVDDRNLNMSILNDGIYVTSRSRDDYPILMELVRKEVLYRDEFDYLRLSIIGDKVCDLLDRDLKLKKLLGE